MADLSAYRFATTHEWVHPEGDEVIVGITEHAQAQLGDVIFVELPAVGTKLDVGQSFGAIESVKAASDLYAPVSGTVVGVNESLNSEPEKVNNDPYDGGWIIRLGDAAANEELMDEAAYNQLVGG